MPDLPPVALSVRQPSAWAIIHGGKDVENRSLGSIRAGQMKPGRIAIHAAIGMKRDEYDYLVWRWARDGVAVPRPDHLPRRAIIGSVTVEKIITASDSAWFGGEAGLLLRDPLPCEPIPCSGALGYFTWTPGGTMAEPLPWMAAWGASDGGMFDTLPVQFRDRPVKPFGTGKSRPKGE